MSAKGVMTSAVVGAAAGALLGVLFAPRKGVETRKRLRKKGEVYAGAVKEKVEEIVNQVAAKSEEIKEDAAKFAKKTKETIDAIQSGSIGTN